MLIIKLLGEPIFFSFQLCIKRFRSKGEKRRKKRCSVMAVLSFRGKQNPVWTAAAPGGLKGKNSVSIIMGVEICF